MDSKLSIDVNCAARTVLADVRPIVDISQKVGIAIEACTFIGSSPIRQYAEDWTLAKMLRVTKDVLVRGGGHKIFRFCDDEPRRYFDK